MDHLNREVSLRRVRATWRVVWYCLGTRRVVISGYVTLRAYSVAVEGSGTVVAVDGPLDAVNGMYSKCTPTPIFRSGALAAVDDESFDLLESPRIAPPRPGPAA